MDLMADFYTTEIINTVNGVLICLVLLFFTYWLWMNHRASLSNLDTLENRIQPNVNNVPPGIVSGNTEQVILSTDDKVTNLLETLLHARREESATLKEVVAARGCQLDTLKRQNSAAAEHSIILSKLDEILSAQTVDTAQFKKFKACEKKIKKEKTKLERERYSVDMNFKEITQKMEATKTKVKQIELKIEELGVDLRNDSFVQQFLENH